MQAALNLPQKTNSWFYSFQQWYPHWLSSDNLQSSLV